MNYKFLLKVENLVCGYEGKEILNGISFDIAPGAFLGIIGPNGAGKTTLFRALTKIIKPAAGNIYFNGKNLLDLPVRQLSKEVAVLTQMIEMPFSFSVEEFVLMGRFPHLGRLERPGARDFEIVENVMKQVNVAHLRGRNIKRLSGGELQRVLLAQALAQEPKLLLLDEPVSHLDIKHQVDILDMLKDFNRSGLTIAIILHDLNLASEYCASLLLLNGGKIHTIGTPEDVLKYKVLEEVYNTIVVVEKNPLSGKPFVLLVSKNARKYTKT